MSLTRRHFFTHSAALVPLGALPHPLVALLNGRRPEPVPPIDDPRLKELTSASLTTARSTGASYADARLTHTFTKRFRLGFPEQEEMAFGVRVLVDGYWGFAASPIWSPDEAARLATVAVALAKTNAIGQLRQVELAPVTSIANGHWTTPVRYDPFAIAREEIDDFLTGISLFLFKTEHADNPEVRAIFYRHEQAFASTDNQFYTQVTYRSFGDVKWKIKQKGMGEIGAQLDCLTPTSVGFELFRDQPLRQLILQECEKGLADLALPVEPVEVGRYETVLDAETIASAVSQTIGSATQIDRALGYEANASGTSYIVDPLTMLGTQKIGAPTVTVTGNRSEVGGAATVQWDDEGATPSAFTLVKDGMLVDMQTNREGAGWLKPYYDKQKIAFRSYGCASAVGGMFAPLTQNANLILQPASGNDSFESLIAGLENGLTIRRGSIQMDFQQISGLGTGETFKVWKGKKVARIAGSGFLFRTQELWNSITRLGGAGSQHRIGMEGNKGEPSQTSWHSVTAVPVTLKELTVIDIMRRA